jgi:hypothetical protein
MARVSVALDVASPPEAAFVWVAEPHRRRRLLPDNFADFRIVSEQSGGPGTRTAFTIVTPHGEHPSEVEVAAWEPPRSLTERTLGPDGYTLHWSFAPAGEGTRVTVTADYPVTGTVLHRLVERFFARKALEQSLLVELTRLKTLAEGGVPGEPG